MQPRRKEDFHNCLVGQRYTENSANELVWIDFSLFSASCSELSAHTVMLPMGDRSSQSAPLSAVIPVFPNAPAVCVCGAL